MPVLTIASSKGGPGKTTLATLLASSLAQEGIQVVALDADPTQAFSRWAASAYEGAAFTCIAEPDETRLAHLIDGTPIPPIWSSLILRDSEIGRPPSP